MKLVRFGKEGREKPGIIDDDGLLRDLSSKVKDIDGKTISSNSLKLIQRVNLKKLNIVKGKPRIGVPISNIGKIVCIGLNYVDHAKEVGVPLPKEPIIFLKPTFKDKNLSVNFRKIKKENLIKETGIIILHRHKDEKDIFLEDFNIIEEKKYGISRIFFLSN